MESQAIQIDLINANTTTILSQLPIHVLRQTTRTKLSSLLNPLQMLPNASGSIRDYRGLAEAFGLTHNEMRIIERCEDPTGSLLKSASVTLQELMNSLEQIERFDVLEDICQLIQTDAHEFVKRSDAVDSKVENCYYNAIVCYDDDDLNEVMNVVSFLESPKVSFKLWLRARDLPAGEVELMYIFSIMASKCDNFLFFCTPKFLQSTQCQSLLNFATAQASNRNKKIIPIILKPCDLPDALQVLTKIDLSRQPLADWTWKRLVDSIAYTKTSSLPEKRLDKKL